MKNLWFCILFLFCGCTFVEPGYVGIKVNSFGSQKGVEDFPLQVGRVFYNPFTETVYEYPTFMQSAAWTEDINEGSPVNESVTFNSSEGATITADVSLNYTLEPEKVPHLFIEFRQPIEVITHGYFRNQVRDSFNRIGVKHKAVGIFGEGKQELLLEVHKDLTDKLSSKGFIIDTIGFIGSPRADDKVMNSINMVIEATQRAIEAENKVKQITAEADQAIEKARGTSESILIEAKSQAEANKLVAESITPELVQYKLLEKWDGIAPKVLGSDAAMLLNMNLEK